MPLIDFLPGNSKTYTMDVAYWAEFPRNRRGFCAFCDGDPVPDPPVLGVPATTIQLYRMDEGEDFMTCPVCLGRPT